MRSTKSRTFLFVSLALGGIVAVSLPLTFSAAQILPSSGCVIITHALSFGSQDQWTGGDVTKLQSFLTTQGYYRGAVIGIFGPVTMRAVQRFQADHGIIPIGIVGPLTRAAIQAVSCGTYPPPSSNLYIQSLTPTSGPIGTTVTIQGSGFTSDNTILFGNGAIAHVSSSGGGIAIACTTDPNCHPGIHQSVTFTVPQSIGPNCPPGAMCPMWMQLVTPGNYNVSVQNQNGTSNAMTFTVIGTSNQTPTITGVDAPASLAVGVQGTWTVNTLSSGGSLHYSVVWGDENMNYPYAYGAAAVQYQSAGSFTHVYYQRGTYTPRFTVSNDQSQSASASATVTVY